MRQITRIGDLLLCHKPLDVNETSPGLLNRGGMDDPHFFCSSFSKNDIAIALVRSSECCLP